MTRIRALPLLLVVAVFLFWTLALIAGAAGTSGSLPQREDIDDKYKWRVEDIYPSIDAWNADFQILEAALPDLGKFKGHLGDSSESLLHCLRLRDSLDIINSNLFVFAYLKLDEDGRKSEYQELAGRISSLNAGLGEAESFIEPEVLSLDESLLESFLAENDELKIYRFYLEDQLRKKEHILSAKEEAILALAYPMLQAPIQLFNMIDAADHKLGTIIDGDGNPMALTYGRYSRILKGTDRELRRVANDTVQESWLRYINTLATNLKASVDKDLFLTRTRNYTSTLERSLNDDNIPTSVYHSLIDAVNANLPILHKWSSLRKKVLGYDTMYTYDLAVPLAPEFEKDYTYEQTEEIILGGLKPLGDAYLRDLRTGLDAGWVDVYENEGKASGAYNWGTYTSHPYILMNYDSTIESVFTLAHEMGHALHGFYTNRNEPFLYHGHSLFTAEVASTCIEAILMKYLLSEAESREEKIMLLNHYISQIDGTFITQTMFAEFELLIHEHVQNGGAVSVDFLRQSYREILQKYYGPDVVIGPNNDLGCLKLYHFYRTFYVYKYATSYAAAQMISQKILEGDKQALDAFLEFLTVGSSDYPIDILKRAGVDMTSPEPVERTIRLFGELVDEMEQLLDEI